MKIYYPKNNSLKPDEISEIVAALKEGAIMIYPTETIYGMGCSAFDFVAVKKIYDLKERSYDQKSSVMVDSIEAIEEYAQVGGIEREFLKRNLPGPVTIVLRLKTEYLDKFAPQVVNEEGGVGFRVIKDFEYLKKISSLCGFPIISTSANKSGVGVERSSSDYVMSFFEDSQNKIDILIDAGDLGVNSPSAVVDITKTPYQVIRRGNFINK